jgi:uncharacterized protein with NAD-binding domain and iron-sulfur cluster
MTEAGPTSAPVPKRERVVILGGGIAALTAAFHLSRPGWRDRFESITIYQMGWRLGGKGASGRGEHDRIEEHGLHLWLGFYENAFRLLQQCYAELDRDWRTGFEKASLVVLQEWHDGRWKSWVIDHPEDARIPGVPDADDRNPSVWDYLVKAIRLMHSLASGADATPAGVPADIWHRLLHDVSAPMDVLRLPVAEHVAGAAIALPAALRLAEQIAADPSAHDEGHYRELLSLLEGFVALHAPGLADTDGGRRIGSVLRLVLAHIKAAFLDNLFRAPEGLKRIDDRDYRSWLRESGGAREEDLDSPIIRGFYDTAFAYENGDPNRPAVAAGQALRGLLRFIFDYNGAIFWRMTAGMGDVVMAPLYEVLRGRGVRFEFFHRVRSLHASSDGASIARVTIERQVDLVDAGAEYRPLVTVKGLPCWPAQPVYDQIKNGDALRGHNLESFWDAWPDVGETVLEAGRDFDRLVFGISLGAVPHVCAELVAANARWARMVERVQTVYTQAFQLWLTPEVQALGWRWSQGTLGSYLEPFDTYADMRQLIDRETWPAENAPRSIAYFCNVLPTPLGPTDPDPAFAVNMHDQVRTNAITFLRRGIAAVWPAAVEPATGDFRWDLLCALRGAGVERFDSQFWRANIDPSERYVLSLPGTDGARLPAHGHGYDNLYLAGDWTDCGFNLGCIEAAVMSGMLASHAIQGVPALTEIISHDHV